MAVKNLAASGVLYTDRRDFYLSPQVTKELWTDVAPFTTMVSNMGTVKPPDPDYKLFEHRSGWTKQVFQLNDGSPNSWSGTTTGVPGETLLLDAVDGITGLSSAVASDWLGLEVEIYADDGAGAIDATAYQGVAFITVAASGAVTLTSLGNPTDATFQIGAVADNSHFLVCGNAFGEGTESPDAFSDELQVVWNTSQIFKTPIEVTGTLYEASLRGYSNELARLRDEKGKTHKMQKERAFLFGMRTSGIGGTAYGASSTADSTFINHKADADGAIVRTTMGIVTALRRYGATSGDAQNVFSINPATYAYSSFVDDTEKVFQYVPSTGVKTAFCGAGMLSYWSKMATSSGIHSNSDWNVTLEASQRDTLGFNFRNLIAPHGTVRLIPTPAMRGPYNDYMIIVDEEHLQHIMYRKPMFQANIKTDNAYDGIKDQYFSDEGLGLTLMEAHSLWKLV